MRDHTVTITAGTLTPGERVAWMSEGPGYAGIGDGIYVGTQDEGPEDWDDEPGSYPTETYAIFRDGHINDIPQTTFGFPLSRITNGA